MMIKRCLLIISVMISARALKDFGTIYLTQNESTTLRLHDYFSHNEIDFYISNTNTTEKDVILKHKSNLDLILYISTPLDSSQSDSTQFGQQFQYFELSEGIVLFRYDNNYLFSYWFSKHSQKLENLWSMQVGNGTISQVVAFYIFNISYLLISSRVCINSAWDLWENELYILELKEFTDAGSLVKLNLWDIKYLSDLKIFTGADNLNVFTISGKFISGKQTLFFYRVSFSKEINIHLIYSLDNYIGSSEHEGSDLNIVQVVPTINQFLILDSKLGLFIYDYFHSIGLTFRGYLDLRKYGTLYSLSYIPNIQLYLIGADNGALSISSRPFHNEYSLITTYDVIGKLVPIIHAEKHGNLYFLQIELEESHNLLVFELSSYESVTPVFLGNFNLKKIIQNNFNMRGMWMFLQIEDRMLYIRHDLDGIRIFALNLEDWTLELWGNNFVYAEIVGKSNNFKKMIIKKSLNVISIPQGSYEIYSLNAAEYNKSMWCTKNFRLYIENETSNFACQKKKELKILFQSIIDLYSDKSDLLIWLAPQNYFLGPNLTYEIARNSFMEDYNASLILPESEITLTTLPGNTEKIRLSYKSIAYSSRNIIKFTNPFLSDLILPESLNLLNIIWTYHFNSYLIIEVEESSLYSIMVYKIDNLSIDTIYFSKIHSNIDCLFFKSHTVQGIEAFACANHENIDVYLINNKIEKYLTLNRENLKFDGKFWITGLEIFARQILLPQNKFEFEIIIYVAFFNEISLIKIRLDIFKGSVNFDYKFVALQNEIIDFSIAFDCSIALLFADCKIDIYDRNLTNLKTLGPHYKGKAKGIFARGFIIVMQVDNEIIVYDWGFLVHEAYKYSFLIGNSCRLFNESKKEPLNSNEIGIPILCKTSEHFVLQWHAFRCINEYLSLNRCFYFPIIKFEQKQEFTQNCIKEGKISILAKNSFYQSTIELKVNLHINGHKIGLDEAKFPSILNTPYNRDEIIDLNNIIIGNNTQISMKINGLRYEDINLAYSPILLHENFNEILSIPWRKDSLHSEYFYVKAANKIIFLTESELIILNFNYENSEIDEEISLKNFSNNTSIKCKSIDAIDFDDNIILIFTICACEKKINVLWNEKINHFYQNDRAIILIVEYDYLKKKVLKSKHVPLFTSSYHLKSVKLSNQRFEIFLFENHKVTAQILINKHILRFEGIRTKKVFNISKKEEIDFLSLGLDLFVVESVDIALSRFGEIFLYVIDAGYGLRIIRIQENGLAEIAGSISHQSPNYFKYVCSCRNRLFILTEKMELFEYIIDDFQTPILSRVLYSDSIKESDILSYKLIPFEANCNYIVASFKMFNGGINLRVWNNYDWYDLKIEETLDIFAFESDLFENNILSFINIRNSMFKLISLDKRYIQIPKYGQKRGKEIEDIWGTNEFRIQFNASNSYCNASSSVMVLKRGQDHSKASLPWWMWLFMCFAATIIVFIIVHCLCYLKNNKKKQDYGSIDEGLMLKTINQTS